MVVSRHGEPVDLIIGESHGFYEVRTVYREVKDWKGERLVAGVMAFKPSGHCWWIAYPEDDEEDDAEPT